MKAQDVRIDMIVEVVSTTATGFYEGQTFMVKGIVYQKGNYFLLTQPISERGSIDCESSIHVKCVEPVKTDLEKVIDNIKKETGS